MTIRIEQHCQVEEGTWSPCYFHPNLNYKGVLCYQNVSRYRFTDSIVCSAICFYGWVTIGVLNVEESTDRWNLMSLAYGTI